MFSTPVGMGTESISTKAMTSLLVNLRTYLLPRAIMCSVARLKGACVGGPPRFGAGQEGHSIRIRHLGRRRSAEHWGVCTWAP